MKKISSILVFLMMLTALAAQTGTVKGTVLDQQSEMPVIGATVQLVGAETPVGAITALVGGPLFLVILYRTRARAH